MRRGFQGLDSLIIALPCGLAYGNDDHIVIPDTKSMFLFGFWVKQLCGSVFRFPCFGHATMRSHSV